MKKISIIFLFLFTGFITFSQTNSLEKRATIQFQNAPFEKVLETISHQTGVRFSYNSQLINPNTKITVTAQNKTIQEILPKILPATVSYKKVGEHVVFVPIGEMEKAESRKQNIEEPKTLVAENRKQNVEEPKILVAESKKVENNISLDNGKLNDDCLTIVSVAKDTAIFTKDTISLTKEEDMKSQIAGILMAVATASAPVIAQDTIQRTNGRIDEWTNEQMDERTNGRMDERTNEQVFEKTSVQDSSSFNVPEKALVPVQLTFFYPLGTGWVKSAEKIYHFSINILGGVTGQLKGFEVGSLFNINRYGAIGAQFAGLFNIAGAKNPDIQSMNAQFAGLFNYTEKGTSVQFAGIGNIGDTTYLQAGGIFNIAHEANTQFGGIFNIAHTTNAQFAGLFNVAHKVHAQFAGLFNKGMSDVPFQAAGLFNAALKTKCQLAGVANIAQESVCQIAGVVNVTKKGCFQMGLINVRDTADGVSLGLINIVKHGGILEVGIEAGEFVHNALTFRSGVQRLYSIISVGYNYTENFLSVGCGLGTSFKLIGNLRLNLELTHATLYNNFSNYHRHYWPDWRSLTQFTPMLNYRFAKHFKIYAGPSLNILHQHVSFSGKKVNTPYSMYHREFAAIATDRNLLDLWIGVVGGIKF
jgi:hypothetical protein